jgi:glycosyltransferase involved in cell wall biosynthesis
MTTVWVVSHAYAAAVNHDKLLALARLPDIDLTVLAPRRWRTTLGDVRLPERGSSYRVIGARILLNGRIGGYLYLDGMLEMRRAKPAVVHAELEPWSLAALECSLAAPSARSVLFTWENLGGPRRLLARAIERLVLHRAAFVIAGNDAARARLLRLGVPTERTARLPQFGVDPERYATGDGAVATARWRLRRPVIGYVGRLVPEKGVDVLVEAMASVAAQLLVVGDGSARAELERRTAGWPVGKAVFTGALDHSAVPDLLACLDVLVLPSRTTPVWAEQFGHVLIEAMAAGVAVVGSSSGAIPEVVGDAGLIFPEGDAAALRRCLASLVGSEALRRSLIERGRTRVAEHFTNAGIAAAQRAIYQHILGRS